MQKPRVLIVEDECVIAMLLKLQLEKNGYEVCATASDGLTAIDSFRKKKPDIILMDIGLPKEMNGIEACKIIKNENPDIPVVFVTGYDNSEIKSQALLLKPLAYLTKPINIKEIIELLDKVSNSSYF